MIRNDPDGFAARLYARIPDHYRAYDAQRAYPVLALFSAVGWTMAALRSDMDALLDDFFIETCADWVVPYLGALLGTKLLPQPVGQSDRLEVWKTIDWRRSRGTPAMLAEMANATVGLPVGFAEFFRQTGWSQNLDDVRADRALTAELRDPARVDRLGHDDDPFAHAVDLRAAHDLDAARIDRASLSLSRTAWGTPGRYRVDQVGYFIGRLRPFPIRGASPAPRHDAADAFTFDPLGHDVPLLDAAARPISRAAFRASPWPAFGRDVAVRLRGISLAVDAAPQQPVAHAVRPFDFGGRTDGVELDREAGIRSVDGALASTAAGDFVVHALWLQEQTVTELGRYSARGGYVAGARAPAGPGTLTLRIRARRSARTRRFPGGVLAVRAARDGGLRDADATFADLAAWYLAPGEMRDVPVMVTDAAPVYPPRVVRPSAVAARADAYASDGDAAVLVDPGRLGGVAARLVLGRAADALTARVATSDDAFVASTEWILPARDGGALLIYLPEFSPELPAEFVVAVDGSSYVAPPAVAAYVGPERGLAELQLARAALGQVVGIPGRWPLEQRVPVAIDAVERRRVARGELGVDPERGRFVLSPGDPAAHGVLDVSTVEAFGDAIGALGSHSPATPRATKIVARFGWSATAGVPVFRTLAEALAFPSDGDVDVVEIVDSATYAHDAPLVPRDGLRELTIRAASGARPCLTCPRGGLAALLIARPLDVLTLEGVLISGAPIRLDAPVELFTLRDVTLDPSTGPSLVGASRVPGTGEIAITRSVCGALAIADAARRLIVADAVVDARGGDAIGSVAVPAGDVHLERTTVFGRVFCTSLVADTALMNDIAVASDRQTGFVRFTRYEPGSVLPRRFASTDERAAYDALTWGRPAYARLAVRTPDAVRTGGETHAELGAFARALDPVRVGNLRSKSDEFLPAALRAAVIAET